MRPVSHHLAYPSPSQATMFLLLTLALASSRHPAPVTRRSRDPPASPRLLISRLSPGNAVPSVAVYGRDAPSCGACYSLHNIPLAK